MRRIIILCLFVFLASCGFHLRGQYEIPEALQFVEIQGDVSIQLIESLKKQLVAKGINVVENEQGTPRALLQLKKEIFDKKVNSLTTSGQVKDYNLNYSVIFSIFPSEDLKETGKSIFIDNQKVIIHQVFDIDQTSILASSNEERVVRSEMYDELAKMIIYRIQALTKRKIEKIISNSANI